MTIILCKHDVIKKNKNNKRSKSVQRAGSNNKGLEDVTTHLVKKKIQRDLSLHLKPLSEVSGQHIRQ